ncbi:rod shape-determining protein MreC [Ferrimonas sediminicola]|uniref:Cell shape-determining protein MreC n=1 Tax=Ferrimonas sediminicola TaxID=2569538 RepID=A0A4U1BIM5_9GAMM|nr:rod shape-determining protein MreC [Ferrimonas sediminicola]TKB51219.1 rod shape-determining protein MreC [Ferrimonas sediminicola]
MKPFFNRGASVQYRLFMAVLLSLALILANDRLLPLRSTMATLVSPLQYLANLPAQVLDGLSTNLSSRAELLRENERLRQRQLLMSEQLLKMANLQEENDRLRALLQSPTRKDARRMVAEVMYVDRDPFKSQILIDKGINEGVYVGQPVLDDSGVVGQVTEVAQSTARVLLIADFTHAIPVRVARNDVRAVAHGSGKLDQLELVNVPMSTDIRVGDLLISSGLGQRFPEGYPVATVTQVVRDEGMTWAQVSAEPVAHLDRIRYLLLLWQNEVHRISPREVTGG